MYKWEYNQEVYKKFESGKTVEELAKEYDCTLDQLYLMLDQGASIEDYDNKKDSEIYIALRKAAAELGYGSQFASKIYNDLYRISATGWIRTRTIRGKHCDLSDILTHIHAWHHFSNNAGALIAEALIFIGTKEEKIALLDMRQLNVLNRLEEIDTRLVELENRRKSLIDERTKLNGSRNAILARLEEAKGEIDG